MNPYAAGVIAVVAIAILSIFYFVDRQQAKKKALQGGIVGPEVLELEDGSIATGFSIPLFNNNDVVSVAINDISDTLASKVHSACEKAMRKQKALRVVLNTVGGDVTTAQTIKGLLRHFIENGHEVWIVVEGKCFSAGMIILMAVEPEYRFAVRGSEFMTHPVKTTNNGTRTTRTHACDAELAASISAGSLIKRSSLDELYKSGNECIFAVDDAYKMNVIGGII